MDYRSPISKARGLGSAKSGTEHWWMQRVTAAALIPLSFWLVMLLKLATTATYQETITWLASPFNAVVIALWILAVCFHAALGVQVVIEDYVSAEGAKIIAVWTCHLLFTAIAVAALFAVLQISLAG
ncbi:succinate dehydrogenase, hydrophobic membrane anchor protein [Methylotuvimicrobium buryatense]|uniref:Succinate dehydrogenase hydrophobic membrane anchor subunit n=1 Tax=Methylotuvimicrobium buryatense TaxID=95641 RepID=A0A4P9UL86_METBY|nr:succinate dehydrogenase, hydrophobic membrane anchor protein [Methylotuvimicrobium buryatense]QCW82022.1 succinate dehydrogenase, hydrophobic membrane anchor protein [Methylotuvimicrobium buryatense]